LKVGAIRKSLKNLPKTLDDTYARILTNIDEDYQREAISALLWLAFSERPLQIDEVAEAAVVNPQSDPPFSPEERLSDPHDVLQILAGLVTIYPKDDTSQSETRLAHFSVKEYLLSDRILKSPVSNFSATSITANDFITRSCILYILHYDKSSSKTMSFKDLECFPLLQYACEFWFIHAKSIPVESRKSIDYTIFQLFLSDTALRALQQVFRPDLIHQTPFRYREDICSPLFYASCIGLEVVVLLLLEHKVDVNVKETYMESTALHQAAKRGHEVVVRLLLEYKADVDAKDEDGRTALYWAVNRGDEAVVRLLLEYKADVDAKDKYGQTALHWAANRGHEAVVRLLLEYKADIDTKNKFGQTALHRAAIEGHESIVRLLKVGSLSDTAHLPAHH
jgi:ankyrin repeat domain-containing protein 50